MASFDNNYAAAAKLGGAEKILAVLVDNRTLEVNAALCVEGNGIQYAKNMFVPYGERCQPKVLFLDNVPFKAADVNNTPT